MFVTSKDLKIVVGLILYFFSEDILFIFDGEWNGLLLEALDLSPDQRSFQIN